MRPGSRRIGGMGRMDDREPSSAGPEEEGFDWTEAGHMRRQALVGLSMTPAERLRWLEETVAYMRRILGRARSGRPAGAPTDPGAASRKS